LSHSAAAETQNRIVKSPPFPILFTPFVAPSPQHVCSEPCNHFFTWGKINIDLC
jgi:hypothetical protein